jgi:hypothetical protein
LSGNTAGHAEYGRGQQRREGGVQACHGIRIKEAGRSIFDDSNQQPAAHETIKSDYGYQARGEVLMPHFAEVCLPSEGISIA